jgi:ribosomal protein S13
MIYIFETNLAEKKPIFFALQKIYGIGRSQSLKSCKLLGFSKNLKLIDLTDDQTQSYLNSTRVLTLM